MDKGELSEQDIRTKFITPAIQHAGWDVRTQVREELALTKGRVIVRGKEVRRGTAKRADYVLYYKPNIPVAVIEAKDANHSVAAGMQQALGYAEMLDVPFVYSSNGDGFLEHDRTVTAGTVEREISVQAFPSPEELWQRYSAWKGLNAPAQHSIVTQSYFDDGSGRSPRYYQLNAINRTIEAIARNQQRILLVMATGTGKTYTAFQIIWRLWKSGAKKRILFLADRNILVDQTKTNDFKPFGSAMTKIQKRQADKSYEIYLALYQAISGTEEERNIYKQFSRDFFDLIIVDECHRGSAAEDSAWREILEYFSSATQIGLTATPKETRDASNIDYFGEPIYVYSLKQGIDDGFLAPYKVVRIDLDKDVLGWRPEHGKRDKYGQEIEDRVYNQIDADRTLINEQRTQLVAQKVTEFLKASNRFDKTIIFCEDIDHAERMRQALVNANADLTVYNRRYVVRITGDSEYGQVDLEDFINPESAYPVIATTSKLMTTGVDAQTCRLIVLDQRIQSMTEFKQIIGRGTRINEEYNKFYFTILDFKKATELFADPAFDGDPVQDDEFEPDEPLPPDIDGREPDDGDEDGWQDEDEGGTRRVKYVVNDVPVYVLAERVQYYGADGRLVTESLRDYTRSTVRRQFASLDAFLIRWRSVDKKEAVISELEEHGVLFEALSEQVGSDLDPFDLVCHVAFDQPPMTRRERAAKVRKDNYFTKYGPQARAVLDALLDKYADEGIVTIEQLDVLKIQPFTKLGRQVELVKHFGGKQGYLAAVRELQSQLYKAA